MDVIETVGAVLSTTIVELGEEARLKLPAASCAALPAARLTVIEPLPVHELKLIVGVEVEPFEIVFVHVGPPLKLTSVAARL